MRQLELLFANMPAMQYEVDIPGDRETLYGYAAPVSLSLAAFTLGLWIVKSRNFHSVADRILLWIAGGSLAVSYTARWIWSHDDRSLHAPTLIAQAAYYMPWLWAVFSIFVLIFGWHYVRPGDRSIKAANESEAPVNKSSF